MRKRILLLLPLTAALWTLPAQAADYPPAVDEMVARAKAAAPAVGMAALAEASRARDTLIVDVRESSEFQAGHVPGAVNLPRGVVEVKIWKQLGWPDALDTHRRVLVYCGLSSRAALAARSLRELGLDQVYWVDMTFADWEKAENPVDF